MISGDAGYPSEYPTAAGYPPPVPPPPAPDATTTPTDAAISQLSQQTEGENPAEQAAFLAAAKEFMEVAGSSALPGDIGVSRGNLAAATSALALRTAEVRNNNAALQAQNSLPARAEETDSRVTEVRNAFANLPGMQDLLAQISKGMGTVPCADAGYSGSMVTNDTTPDAKPAIASLPGSSSATEVSPSYT